MTLDRIVEIACGYRAAKVLLTAVELGVFTALSERPVGLDELTRRTGLHARGARDFFDTLVALKILDRDSAGNYANTPAAEGCLVRGKPGYIGDVLEQYCAREYGLWDGLPAGLRTGLPQAGIAAKQHFPGLYSEADAFRRFVKSMTAGTLHAAMSIAEKFPWANYRAVVDVGTSEGCLPVQVAQAHPHIRGVGFDLPPLRPMFEAYVADHGLSDRLNFQAGDFFAEELPAADVLVFGRILHNWDMDAKRMLLRKAHAALPKGGALVVHETLIASDRRADAAGLLASLNMLLWTSGGFDFTAEDCIAWMRDAGFDAMRVEPLTGGQSMIWGLKP